MIDLYHGRAKTDILVKELILMSRAFNVLQMKKHDMDYILWANNSSMIAVRIK